MVMASTIVLWACSIKYKALLRPSLALSRRHLLLSIIEVRMIKNDDTKQQQAAVRCFNTWAGLKWMDFINISKACGQKCKPSRQK